MREPLVLLMYCIFRRPFRHYPPFFWFSPFLRHLHPKTFMIFFAKCEQWGWYSSDQSYPCKIENLKEKNICPKTRETKTLENKKHPINSFAIQKNRAFLSGETVICSVQRSASGTRNGRPEAVELGFNSQGVFTPKRTGPEPCFMSEKSAEFWWMFCGLEGVEAT